MYEDLNKILERRVTPHAPQGLSERIIAASLRARQHEKWTLTGFIKELWIGFSDLFVLPQPAFALMFVLLTGVTLGVSGQVQSVFASSGDEMMGAYALADDSYENGEFL